VVPVLIKSSKEKAMVPLCNRIDLYQIPTRILVDKWAIYKISQKFSLTNKVAWQFVDEDP
jgi:hypothetical protein